MNKRLKFAAALVPLVLSGEKTSTWRLFDDKNLSAGDIVNFINSSTGETFAVAQLLKVYEKPLGQLTEDDWVGHERFTSNDIMFDSYKNYYGREVDGSTLVKIVRFKLQRPKLIIISGSPGTGKTSIGRQLAQLLQVQFISKDDFKELLYDDLGAFVTEGDWLNRLRKVSYSLLYNEATRPLKVSQSVIIESNFLNKYDASQILALKDTYSCDLVQVHFHTNDEIVVKRVKERAGSGNRHPVHIDTDNTDNYIENFLTGRVFKIDLGDHLYIDVDTTDFDKIDLEAIAKQITAYRSDS